MNIIKLTVYFKFDVTFVAIMVWVCHNFTPVHILILSSDGVYHQGSWIFKSKLSILVEIVSNFALWSWVKPAGQCDTDAVAVIKSLYLH